MTKRNDSGILEAIWTKRAHRGPMDSQKTASLTPETGLVGSVDRSKRRQVTILDIESWLAAASETGTTPDPSKRRANLLVRGIDFEKSRGLILRIGSTVEIAIGGETLPCERMEEVSPGLQLALRPRWRAGVFGKVLVGGDINVGDAVSLGPPDGDLFA